MSSFKDRDRQALLVVDMQVGVVARAWRREPVIETIVELVRQARSGGVPVIWVQHSDANLSQDSAEWQFVPELQPLPSEQIVAKHFGDAFEDTQLDDVLGELGIGQLNVCGAATDACVMSTLFAAWGRGYDVDLVADAHTTEDISAYGSPYSPEQIVAALNFIWGYRSAPDRAARVLPASEVQF